MPTIKILPNELINKIAAGEVIERPANVVKELVENSIDAGATKIFIEVKEGGKSLIKVSDNGHGMDKEDGLLSLKRHSTSKIKDVNDLFSIKSLGFRGEALASVAAVSYLTLTTNKDGFEGTQIKVESGKVVSVKQLGCPVGTTVEVNNLFFNTPVRKKYLKTIETELAVISDIVTRYSLANPKIFFKLVHNCGVVINSPSTNDTLGNLVYVYGRKLAKNLLPVNYSKNGIEIMGLISEPQLTKADKSYQSVFVNNRYVKNKVVNDALSEAYHTLLNIGRHPVAVLNINIDPKKIDVNVHPTKSIIRVLKEDELYFAVYDAVKTTLKQEELIPEVELKHEFSFKDVNRKYDMPKFTQTLLEPVKEVEVRIEPIKLETKLPHMAILGQVHKTYIVAESESGLLILDQHAAQERVKYEEFMGSKKDNAANIQELVNPDVIELSPKDSILLNSNLESLKNIGFNVEHFGGNSFILRTVPEILGKVKSKEFLLDLISEVANAKKETDKLVEERLIRAACRASVKAGDELTLPQIRILVERLGKCSQPFTCPHGRPTVINMTLNELEKKFKRIV